LGGYNSGPYGFFGKTGSPTVGQSYGIDVRRWKREGLLHPGTSFGWTWTNNNGSTSSISVSVPAADKLKLAYTVTRDGVKTPVSELLSLGFSECNYGGKRYWFHCPGCFERVACLYLRGSEFKCRHCHRITYGSCQESGNQTDEQERRVNRILTKLKSKKVYGFDIMSYKPRRPRGMHWKTYKQLLLEYEDEQMNYIIAMTGKIEGMNKRIVM
jgi:hypothetical protein